MDATKLNRDWTERRKAHDTFVASLPLFTPGMEVRCPTHNADGSPIDDDDVKGCGSTNVVWDGLEMYDCLDCGIFFAPYAANPVHQRARDNEVKAGSL